MKTLVVPIIESDEDLEEALGRIETLMREGDKDADDEVRVLGLLVQEYEREHIPFREPSAIETLAFVLRERGLSSADLVPYLGSEEVVEGVMSGREPLTAPMIRRLSQAFGIPIAALV